MISEPNRNISLSVTACLRESEFAILNTTCQIGNAILNDPSLYCYISAKSLFIFNVLTQ